MQIRSITLKLLPFIIGAFILVTICVQFISKAELTTIIDKSQKDIFAEKIDVIWEHLKRVDTRLQKTGLVEAYADDFKNSTVTTLRDSYYQQPDIDFKPIIIDRDATVILHPELPTGEVLQPGGTPVFQGITDNRGDFFTTAPEARTWYIFRVFEPWGWTILYAVPAEEKYADVSKFSHLLFVIMSTITLLVVSLLSLIITKLMAPVRTLTDAASQVTQGNLDHPIAIRSNDEIGVLAKSFDIMRVAIKGQISQLHQEVENREKIASDLRTLERYLSDIINSMPSTIIGIDEKMRVTQWNSNAEQMTGIKAADACGTPLDVLVPEFFDISGLIDKSLAQNVITTVSKRERETGAGRVLENLTIYPLAASEERKAGAVIRIDNVTKEHELELQVAHSSKMDAIGQLAGGVAHDFNNMLAGILGAAQMIQLAIGKDQRELSRYLDMIITSSTRAADLTRKLLAFGRKGKIVSTAIDIHDLLNDSITILQRTIDKRVTISTAFAAGHQSIVGDTTGLQNVFLNLGINASHAMPEGGELQIRTANVALDDDYCRKSPFRIVAGEYIRIEFQDNGHGITQDNLDKIFDPFFTTKKQGEGAGLGLAAAYGTVRDHHGVIGVDSTPGQGSTFQILLPCSDEKRSETPADDELLHGAGNVLLVDDEEVIRITGKHILEQLGYTVFLAETGDEAVTFIRENRADIDIVIMDMIMPVMDGKEAILQIKRMKPDQKILISSGFFKPEYRRQLNEQQIEGWIHKPYRMSELSQAIANATSSHSQ